jgi:hypothetical protein
MPKTVKRNNSENNIASAKLVEKSQKKLTWPEELWNWVHDIIKWTWKAVFNTIAAGSEFARAWASKLAQIAWSKDPEIREIRKKIVRHHITQGKRVSKEALKWGWKAVTWTAHTTKWALRTVLGGVYDSWKETITWLRNKESGEEVKKEPTKKLPKNPKEKKKTNKVEKY